MEPIITGPERRERITAEIMERTGITEAMIERLVRGFTPRFALTRCWRRSSISGSRIGSRISRRCARSGRQSR
jgi:hypothetical protein